MYQIFMDLQWMNLVSVTEQWIGIKARYRAKWLSEHFGNSLIPASSTSVPNKTPTLGSKLEPLVTWNIKVAKVYSFLQTTNEQKQNVFSQIGNQFLNIYSKLKQRYHG